MITRTRITAAAICLALAAATTASAANRYASPTGTGTTCGEFAPCDLPTAVNGAGVGDFVRVASGTYNLTSPLVVNTGDVAIVGESGAKRPVINSTGAFLIDNADPAGLYLRDLRINANADSGSSIFARSATINRLDIATTSGIYQALAVRDLFMMDSVVRSVTVGGVAVVTTNATIFGSTIIANADSGSRALSVYPPYFGPSPTAEVSVMNSILVGGNTSIDLSPDAGSSALLNIDYSSYSGVAANATSTTNVGTHNVGAPLLVDLPGRTDIHQAPGSPTLNAGNPAATSLGLDFEGQARIVGPAPDIGADEQTAKPALSAVSTDQITNKAARVRAMLAPGGLTTTYRVQWGTSTAYGHTTTPATVSGTAPPTAVAPRVTGLPAARVIHYRLVATNALGTTRSSDRTFRTKPAPPVVGPVSLPLTRVHTGTAFAARFNLNRRASIVMTLTRLRPGRISGGVCRLGATSGTRCTVRILRATLTGTVAAGSPVTRRIGAAPAGRALAPGRYEVRVVAVDLVTGLRSSPRTAVVVITP